MRVNLIPLTHCALDADADRLISNYGGKLIDKACFHSEVSKLSEVFLNQDEEQYALFYEQAYPFCVSLFALLHSHKKVWIAGNNNLVTAEQLTDLGCQLLGDWQGNEMPIETGIKRAEKLRQLNSTDAQITIFTSGSTGTAKAINKSLQQLQSEIETLEHNWGQQLANAQVFGTVSHQHIYGLLFRVLWPLAAGRCFYSEMYLSPEPLIKLAKDKSACWVASPAQLKRLDDLTPWADLANLNAIFSSGGNLSITTAALIAKRCDQKVLEVYGSSETGGIAWRKSVDNEYWQLFDGISIDFDEMGCCHILSPYLAEPGSMILDDTIKMVEGGRFSLLGRIDRIVKVEEKRLSLDSLENRLYCSDWVQQAYTLFLADKRDKIASILVLTDSGNEYLRKQGRQALIKALRNELMSEFETVVLPRKWLFVSVLPLTPLGKINQQLLVELLSLQKTHFPQVLGWEYQQQSVNLELHVLSDLVYFEGHFPGQPILPGVTQLAWVERFAKLFFNFDLPFLRMEVIKFKKVIRPGELIIMSMSWRPKTGKLYFELKSGNDSHSSGRMVYGDCV